MIEGNLLIRASAVLKSLLIVTILIFAPSFFAQGQSKKDVKSESLEQELMRLQRAEDEAESKRDFAALERLLTDDYIFTAPNGAISDKKKLIEDIKNDDEGEAGQTINYEDVKVHAYGKTAVVNYQLVVKGKDKDGKDYSNRYRNTVVWVRQQNRWRMAAIHVSRIRT